LTVSGVVVVAASQSQETYASDGSHTTPVKNIDSIFFAPVSNTAAQVPIRRSDIPPKVLQEFKETLEYFRTNGLEDHIPVQCWAIVQQLLADPTFSIPVGVFFGLICGFAVGRLSEILADWKATKKEYRLEFGEIDRHLDIAASELFHLKNLTVSLLLTKSFNGEGSFVDVKVNAEAAMSNCYDHLKQSQYKLTKLKNATVADWSKLAVRGTVFIAGGIAILGFGIPYFDPNWILVPVLGGVVAVGAGVLDWVKLPECSKFIRIVKEKEIRWGGYHNAWIHSLADIDKMQNGYERQGDQRVNTSYPPLK